MGSASIGKCLCELELVKTQYKGECVIADLLKQLLDKTRAKALSVSFIIRTKQEQCLDHNRGSINICGINE